MPGAPPNAGPLRRSRPSPSSPWQVPSELLVFFARPPRPCGRAGSFAVLGLAQYVPDAADRADQRRRARVLELAPQITDVHAQRVGAGAEVIPPHAVVDQAVGEDAARIEHQQLEQL